MTAVMEPKSNPVAEMLRVIQTDLQERLQRGALQYQRDRAILIKHQQLVEELGDQLLLAQLHDLRGRVEYEVGDFGEAAEHWQAAYKIFEKRQDFSHMALVQNSLGELYLRLHLLDEALECYQQARDLAEQAGDIGVIMQVEASLGMLWLLRGDRLKARICFSLVIAVTEYESWHHVLSIVNARRGLAEVYLATQNFNAAWHEANESEHLAAGRGLKLQEAQAFLTKARIAEQDPNTPGAMDYYYKKGREALRTYGSLVVLGRALMQEARYAQHLGRPQEARDLAQEALAAFQSANLPNEVLLAETLLEELS